MEHLKRYAILALKDIWAFILLSITGRLLRDPESDSSPLDLLTPSTFQKRIEYWLGFNEIPFILGLNILGTTIFLTFFITALLTYLVVVMHVLYPFAAKTTSCALLPFGVILFYHYSEQFQYKAEFISFSILLGVFRIYRNWKDHDPVPYQISQKLLGMFFKQDLDFYFCILSQWLMIVVDLFIFRALDLCPGGFKNCVPFVCYIIAFVHIPAYSIRAKMFIYFSTRKLPVVEQSSIYDNVFVFFNSRCFALCKPFSMISSIINIFYTRFILRDRKTPTIFEFPKTSAFECTMWRKSFFDYIFKPHSTVWKGELRNKLIKFNIKEDITPSMFLVWMFVYTTIGFIQDGFLRAEETFVIVFSHFLILIEIFNTYVFVEVYRQSYGVASPREKKDDDFRMNQVAVSQIDRDVSATISV